MRRNGRRRTRRNAAQCQTIFFSDVVNFTETTEKLESEDLTNLLNRYLTEMSDIALKYGATIDKYTATPSWCSSATQSRVD